MLTMKKIDITDKSDLSTLEYCCRDIIPINIKYLINDPELNEPMRGIYTFTNSNDDIVGCIFLSSLDYILCNIYKSIFNEYPEIDANNIAYSVHPNYRRQGYGTKMLSMFLEILNKNHINYNFLVENNNISSIKVLQKNGIDLTKSSKVQYSGFNQSALFFNSDCKTHMTY
jgi:RimJ/RimL family protein N-acetyltransferase